MRIAFRSAGWIPGGILVAAAAAIAFAAWPARAEKAATPPIPLLRQKDAPKAAAGASEDPLGRSTPFGTVLGYETSADQVRAVAGATRPMLSRHPGIEGETARVSVTAFRDASVEVEVFANIGETGDAAFLAVQEELLLRITEIVEGSGAKFAVPPPRR